MSRSFRFALLLLPWATGASFAQTAAETPAAPPPPTPVEAWTRFVRAKVMYNVHEPKPLPKGDTRTVIHFLIGADGTAHDVEVTTASGCDACDAAAVHAVVQSSPFPPIPPEMNKDQVEVSVPITAVNRPPPPHSRHKGAKT